MSAEEILEKYKDLFVQQDWAWMVVYKIAWALVRFFHATVEMLENGLDKVLTFNGFFENEGLNNISTSMQPVVIGIFAITVTYIGFQLIMRKGIKRSDVFTNVLLAASLIVGMPFIISTLNDLSQNLVQAGKEAGSDVDTKTLSTTIVATNTHDLLYMARKTGWKEDEETFKNNDISDKNFATKDFNGVINASDDKDGIKEAGDYDYKLSDQEREWFGTKLIDKEGGGVEKVQITPAEFPFIGQVGLLNHWYYRYHANFFTMYAQFIVVGFVLIFAMFKTMILFMEIAFLKIITPFIAATDLTTGQRMKQLFNNLVTNYAAIGILMFVIKIYMLAMTYLSSLNWNPLLVTVAMIALGKFVIDGPEEAKRLLGVDVGVKDGYQALMGSLAVGGAALGAGKMLGKGVKSAKEGISNLRETANDSERDGLSSKIGRFGASKANQAAYAAGEMSELGLKGYATNATKEGIEKSKEALNSKAEGIKDAIQNNSVSEAFAEGKANAAASVEAEATAMTPESRNAMNKVLADNEGVMSTGERTVLEKVISGDSQLSPSERQVLERLAGSSMLSPEDRTSINKVLDQSTSSNAQALQDKTAVQRYLTEKSGDLSTEDRTAVQKLIEQPGTMTPQDRLAIERVLEEQGNNINTQDRTAIERLLHENSGSNVQSQDRTGIERIQSIGNTGIAPHDRTAIERVIEQNANNINNADRQVLERVMLQNGGVSPQDRTAIERIIQDKGNNISTQDRTAIERLLQTSNGGIATQDRTAIENVLTNPGNNISSQDRTAIERVISNPGTATAQDRQSIERVITQNSGQMTSEQRTAFEKVNQQLGTSITSPSGQDVTQKINQTVGSAAASNNIPDIAQKINQQTGTTVNGNATTSTNQQVNQTSGAKLTPAPTFTNNKVNETVGSRVTSGNTQRTNQVNETLGSRVTPGNTQSTSQVNETLGSRVTPGNTQSTSQVNETLGSRVTPGNTQSTSQVNETLGSRVTPGNTQSTSQVNETLGSRVTPGNTQSTSQVNQTLGSRVAPGNTQSTSQVNQTLGSRVTSGNTQSTSQVNQTLGSRVAPGNTQSTSQVNQTLGSRVAPGNTQSTNQVNQTLGSRVAPGNTQSTNQVNETLGSRVTTNPLPERRKSETNMNNNH